MIKHRILWFALAVIAVSSRVYAEDIPVYTLEPIIVQGKPGGKETVGPYNQPVWAAQGRFSPNTDVYVLPPYEFVIDLDYQGTKPKRGKTSNLLTQEFELGLPNRFQIAFENNYDMTSPHKQVTVQTIEGRYALADWGTIPLNPTLFAEYKFGVGKDYEGQEDSDDPLKRISNAVELRLLLGEQFGKYQWALNIFQERQNGGEREWETGFSQAISYPIRDNLRAGIEMQFIHRSDAETRSNPQHEFTLGPSLTWKPSQRTSLDLAMLFGTSHDSPRAKMFAVFSYSFGKGEENEYSAPVSTKNR